MPDDFERRATDRVESLGADIDTASFAASFDLFRLGTRVMSDFDAAVHRPLGLSLAGFRVLFTLWVHGSLEVREIARLAGVSRAAVSGVVTTLERDGLAVRQRDQADGRLATVRLTTDGDARLQSAYRAQNIREQRLFVGLDGAELAAFTATLRKLLAVQLDGEPENDPARERQRAAERRTGDR